MGVPRNGRFTMENPIKMDDLGVPLCQEATFCVLYTDVTYSSMLTKSQKCTKVGPLVRLLCQSSTHSGAASSSGESHM